MFRWGRRSRRGRGQGRGCCVVVPVGCVTSVVLVLTVAGLAVARML